MKKLFLTLIITSAVLFVQAQSLSTVKGKTRDGKSVEVKYYHGTISDQIESVKYQVADELQTRVNALQSDVQSLQRRLDAANEELKRLRSQVSGGNADAESLRQEIEEKNASIEELNQQKASLNGELLMLEVQQLELQARYDSLLAIQSSELKDVIAEPARTDQAKKSPVVGLEFGIGPVFMGNSVNEGWAKDNKVGGRVAVYFGTPRLSESFPISIEAGAGMRRFTMAAHQNMFSETLGCTDLDGDAYQANIFTTNLDEQLNLSYLDIPIRLCFGQPAKDHVTAYFKIGITPSINLLSDLKTSGTYTLNGYYPEWDVTLEDIPELGFGSGEYHENATADINKFNIWGNVAFGACVPFKGTPILLSAGVKADYSLLSIGKVNVGQHEGTPLRKAGILNEEGKVFIPSVEIGLVYSIK